MGYKNIFKKENGITLIELILVMALLGLIMVPLYSLFLTQYKTSLVETSRAEAQHDASQSLNMIIEDLRKYEASSSTYDVDGKLVKIADGQIININNEIKYHVLDGVLKRNNQDICKNIKQFSVVETNNGYISNIIEIDFTVGIGSGNIASNDIVTHYSYRRKLLNVK